MPNCANCGGGIGNRRHRECDCCKRKIHIDCTDLQQVDDRLTRAKLKCVKIVCNACSDNIDQFAGLKNAIEAMRADMNSRLTSFDEKLEALENKITTIDGVATSSPLNRETTIREALDRIHRSKNVIVQNVPEHAGSVADRKEHDSVKVSEILTTIGSTSSPVSVIRLGKARADGKPRALRVVFADSHAAKCALRNKKKLIDSPALSAYKIYDDRTRMEIDYLEELRRELKRRMENGEPDLTIRYSRGVPEISKIVQKK